jgi:hypothetical protein
MDQNVPNGGYLRPWNSRTSGPFNSAEIRAAAQRRFESTPISEAFKIQLSKKHRDAIGSLSDISEVLTVNAQR